jgi:arabinose-5-phosphate isomerase
MVEHGAWAEPDEPPPGEAASAGETREQALLALRTERDGLDVLIGALGGQLGERLSAVVETILEARGRVVVTGIGKSGHIGRKVAATFASTGTAAMYLHPAEASHGDLGMVTRDDIVLALSWSGETVELRDIIHYAGRYRIPLIAMTSSETSALAQAANVALILPKAAEACPHNLAPTTSTLMQLALGDAIAVTLLQRRGFTPNHFQRLHPGGKLGVALLKVRNVMRSGGDLPLVGRDADMRQVLLTMSAGLMGCALVVDEGQRLAGVLTDGDLRRAFDPELFRRKPADIMTPRPKTVRPDMLASAALEMMNAHKIAVLPVTERGRVIGLLHMHHLVAAGLS